MTEIVLALAGAAKVLLAGLLLGAGLPALFGLGIRTLAMGVGGDAEVDGAPPKRIGTVLALIVFAIVLAAVALGIAIIVAGGFGKAVSFEHIIPVVVDKK